MSPKLFVILVSAPDSSKSLMITMDFLDDEKILNQFLGNFFADNYEIIQVESIEAVNNINDLIEFDEIDAVMIGPYDLSGSLGVSGELDHPLVKESINKVIEACNKKKISCH